jgi:UDP:flavonoid glycosyltransferase YjiC (YdhE family)
MATGHERSILLAPASDILFHVGRCVVLAHELARRGHRVTLAGTPRYLSPRGPTASCSTA